ncbi:MAG: prepilin-type N-terminal cleavage/methylation domain-containing protein [Phycisphaerae bacterium]|nr:prepilin-type N-terminal cleavage/methylation domain-containing protein [Phycisphaerae bacterium]
MHPRNGFTLIELLVVVAVIALLVSILLPSLGDARAMAKSAQCRCNMKNIGLGMIFYQQNNNDCVLPSYNMVGSGRGPDNPLDGWCAILGRDRLLPASERGSDTVFWCPNTKGAFGMSGDTIDPDGFQYWPVSSVDQTLQEGVTIPERGFNKIIRCSYWINANNPIGTTKPTAENDKYYTGSVGYTAADGTKIRPTRAGAFKRPAALIAVADGVYAGQQSATHIGENKRRIAYRHRGPSTNVLLADGHVDSIRDGHFPHAISGKIPREQALAEHYPYTLYADPDYWLSDEP